MTTKNNYEAKKNSLIRKAVEDRKTIVTVRSSCGNEPIAFSSQKAFDKYKQRLTKKQQAG